jgi:large subunit ribosomal protein L4
MPKVSVFNMKGETVGELELSPEVFEAPYHQAVLHQVMLAQQANARRGTHKVKTRGEVSGGGKKPWRQKGTGMARHGSRRSPIWKGGGISFGPQPRSYGQKIPKKMRHLAMRSALSQRLREEMLTALSELTLDEFSTRTFAAMLAALKVDGGRTLVVVNQPDLKVEKSAANLPGVKLVRASNLNLLDLVKFPRLVATREALQSIQEVLS